MSCSILLTSFREISKSPILLISLTLLPYFPLPATPCMACNFYFTDTASNFSIASCILTAGGFFIIFSCFC